MLESGKDYAAVWEGSLKIYGDWGFAGNGREIL